MNSIKNGFSAVWHAIIRTFAFINKEIRLIWHQPRLIFSLILGPFLILLLFGVGYRNIPRTLTTLFMVPEGSAIEASVEQYGQSLGERIEYAGITHSAEDADEQLRAGDVDLVVVTPGDPMANWQNDEQATFTIYHNEIDPIEEAYIQVIGDRYAEEINKQVLQTTVAQTQQEAANRQEELDSAKTHASAVRQALAAGERAQANASAEALQEDLNVMVLALGAGMQMAAGLEEMGGNAETSSQILAQMEALQGQSDDMVAATAEESSLSEGEAKAAELESSLDELDGMLTTFQGMDTAVLVAPFRSESLSVTNVALEPMHFYVPAVIALLLQHLAITLSGLSIIREKIGGSMELFRAAPVTAFELLFGKTVSYLLLIGVLSAVLTALIILGLRVPQLGTWASYALVILALLLASLGIGFNISITARSDSQAIQLAMLTLLASIFFSGFFLPLYRLSPPVNIVSWLLPSTYGTILLKDVMLRGQAPSIVLLLMLFAFAVALFLLGWIRLKLQMARE